ncbi:glycosyltransferase family 4 protein [Sphingomonas montana]|uniref:glycosyltransferase family 4 protein n=1 Tax=Sphingomonas montana TaxID=1843236 RepID=UPI00096DB4C9|nr:glycosyltransferase family 4 protein [Sphingomonas montana]
MVTDRSVPKPDVRIDRIAIVGNHPPRLCGIATFSRDTALAMRAAFPDLTVDVYAMNDVGASHDYAGSVVAAIGQDDIADYRAAARLIDESGAQVVMVQHEYGIFGGPAGANLLTLLDRVSVPVIVVLHTVLETPNVEQRAVIEALARRASKLIVMAEKGRDILERVHGLSRDAIAVVPHGVPDRPFGEGAAKKTRFGFDGRKVLMTFGLLSPNKGIETMLRALPAIVAQNPSALYVILGATHPHLVAREGEAYRDGLRALADELGVIDNIQFVDGFLEQELLLDYVEAADIYVTPYLNEAQITSGTLAYAVSLGKPVVSTPYWHASELLSDGTGILAAFGDSDAFAQAINALFADPARMRTVAERAYAIGRGMTWETAAHRYMAIMHAAVERQPVRMVKRPAADLPTIAPNLAGVERITDGCGMIQHSIFAVPDRDHGYCVDDNCRALMLMHRIDGPAADRADQLATVYASFVQHAWNGETGRFRNFMGFDRSWLESVGSEDSFGRSLWSIGDTAARARKADMRRWALHLFDQVAPYAMELGSPRTWAFALLGADAILDVHPSHAVAQRLVKYFGDKLARRLADARRGDWVWFEAVLGYDNARLPEAMIRAGARTGNAGWLADGLAAMTWLEEVHTGPDGNFRAVGTESFGREYQGPLRFDQQPLEAWATIDAALTAYRVTGAEPWRDAALRAYRWYLGANDVGIPIASISDGGCFDGLMSDRVNLNQGAESVLAFQFACCAMASLAVEPAQSADDRTSQAS